MNGDKMQLPVGTGDLLNVGVLVAGGIWLWRITRAQTQDLKEDMHRGEQRLKDDMSQMEGRLKGDMSQMEGRLRGDIKHVSDRVDRLGEQLASHTHP